MSDLTAANPFEVLRLAPEAGEEEIVRQAGRLRQRVTEEETLTQIRQAVQALTSRPEERQRLALLTPPRPEYTSAVLERLAAVFRRSPVVAGSATACPELDQEELLNLLLLLAVEELEQTQAVFEPVLSVGDPAEIQRQLAEAWWQSLICDLRV